MKNMKYVLLAVCLFGLVNAAQAFETDPCPRYKPFREIVTLPPSAIPLTVPLGAKHCTNNQVPTGYWHDQGDLFYFEFEQPMHRVGKLSAQFLSPAPRWGVDETGVYNEGIKVISKTINAQEIKAVADSILAQSQIKHQLFHILNHVIWIASPDIYTKKGNTLEGLLRANASIVGYPKAIPSKTLHRVGWGKKHAPLTKEELDELMFYGDEGLYASNGNLLEPGAKPKNTDGSLSYRILNAEPVRVSNSNNFTPRGLGMVTQNHVYHVRDGRIGFAHHAHTPFDLATYESIGYDYFRDKNGVYFGQNHQIWPSYTQRELRSQKPYNGGFISDEHCACSFSDSKNVCRNRLISPERKKGLEDLEALVIKHAKLAKEVLDSRTALGFAQPSAPVLPLWLSGVDAPESGFGFFEKTPGQSAEIGIACVSRLSELLPKDFLVDQINGVTFGRFTTLKDSWIWFNNSSRALARGELRAFPKGASMGNVMQDDAYLYVGVSNTAALGSPPHSFKRYDLSDVTVYVQPTKPNESVPVHFITISDAGEIKEAYWTGGAPMSKQEAEQKIKSGNYQVFYTPVFELKRN